MSLAPTPCLLTISSPLPLYSLVNIKKGGAEEDKIIKRLEERSVQEIKEMRNQFNHHHHLHHKSTFLPILCSRPCIKDVAIANSASSSDDPLSPRVGCMGQVKRNNRVVGFPASHRFTAAAAAAAAAAKNANSVKYSKLKKFFSSKNLVATPGSIISGSRRELIVGGRRGSSKIDCHEDENYASVINVVDLDPPLPVIKRVQQRGDGGDSESLWKRRSGGVALKTLQLKPLRLPPHSLQSTSV